jgi:hypothetical protein
MNTTASFEITTPEDYIQISDVKYYFKSKCDYNINSIVDDINGVIKDSPLQFEYQDGHYGFSSKSMLMGTIKEFTHRAGLICGLYGRRDSLLVFGFEKVNFPLINYGNVLYLKSNLPKTVGLNIKDNETQQCIAYKSIEFIYNGLPIICRKEGEWINIKSENMNSLSFQLCDCFLEPIICRSPVFLTLEVFF